MGVRDLSNKIELFAEDRKIVAINIFCMISKCDSEKWVSKERITIYFKTGKREKRRCRFYYMENPEDYIPQIDERYRDITTITKIIDDVPEND